VNHAHAAQAHRTAALANYAAAQDGSEPNLAAAEEASRLAHEATALTGLDLPEEDCDTHDQAQEAHERAARLHEVRAHLEAAAAHETAKSLHESTNPNEARCADLSDKALDATRAALGVGPETEYEVPKTAAEAAQAALDAAEQAESAARSANEHGDDDEDPEYNELSLEFAHNEAAINHTCAAELHRELARAAEAK